MTDQGLPLTNLSFAVNDDEYVLDISRKGSIKCRLWKNDEDITHLYKHNHTKYAHQVQFIICEGLRLGVINFILGIK